MQKIQKNTPVKMPVFSLIKLMRHPELKVREKHLKKVLMGFEGYRKATEERKRDIEKNAFSKISLLLEAEYDAKEAELGHKAGELRDYISKKYMLEREELEECRKFLGYGTDMPFFEGEQELKKIARDALAEERKFLDRQEKRELKLLGMKEKLVRMHIWQNMPDEKISLFCGLVVADALIAGIDAIIASGVASGMQYAYPQEILFATLAVLNFSLFALTYISIKKDLPEIKELAGKLHRMINRAVEEN
ncbi:hypothetical protein COU37_04445 [Candidatus Micrarchaeota archaeon CG10_big_fil_rev_8_21_14_0_10_45_29]|nr:MAG: hypothetical protein COU37_04445 [Candidatus Micrarchaeota archaeon CG10_big_fil_rev_8_21_14_0_10_45_29]